LKRIELGRYHRFALEFILIVAGVLAALAVDDWRQSRADVATERYILEGLLADLSRDREDIASSISAASARAAGADKLLADVGSTAAGTVQLTPWTVSPSRLDQQQVFEKSRTEYLSTSFSTTTALRMLTSSGSMQRVNVSSPTFTEASASGDMDKIRNVELRVALAQYYYDAARFGDTTDQRVDNHWLHLRNVLASGGLPSGSLKSEETILQILSNDDALIAEIINARELAVSQMMMNTIILELANDLAESLQQALQ